MSHVRIALANLSFPESPDASVAAAEAAVQAAGDLDVDLVCFPECFVPGYRTVGRSVPLVDAAWLEEAWGRVAAAAERASVGVVLGTERVCSGPPVISTLVIGHDGAIVGFQDKVQLDPSEEGLYGAGTDRRVFSAGPLVFGVSICHEAWRYPETVRLAVRDGAQLVFVPHIHEAETGSYRPSQFADPANTFHEKALLCRAAENTCFIAAVNYASDGSPTTSAVVRPDGTLLVAQPYGQAGLLVADLDLSEATRLLATRLKTFVTP